MENRAKEVKLVDIDSIVLNPKNPNKHPPEQIKRLEKLIKYQGFRNPCIVSNRSGFLVVGHGRIEAAKNLGMTSIPVIYQDFESEAQEYSYVVSDNAIAEWANQDKSQINIELKELELDDIELLGFEDFEVIEPDNKEDKEVDLSFDYKLEIDCKDEITQQQTMAELIDRGLQVRVLL